MMRDLPVILFSVLLNAGAQLLLKHGLNQHGPLGLNAGAFSALNAWVIAGVVVYGISVLVWMVVLSRVEVSLAYPMLSVGYVVNAFIAWEFFNEQIGVTRAAGIGLIVLGVLLLTWGETKHE